MKKNFELSRIKLNEKCYTPLISEQRESSEDKYDRNLFGWVLTVPLIVRILIGINWANYWMLVMDIAFIIMFITGMCMLFYKSGVRA